MGVLSSGWLSVTCNGSKFPAGVATDGTSYSFSHATARALEPGIMQKNVV